MNNEEMEHSEETQALQEDALRYVLLSLGSYTDVEMSGAKIIERGEGCCACLA